MTIGELKTLLLRFDDKDEIIFAAHSGGEDYNHYIETVSFPAEQIDDHLQITFNLSEA